VTAFRATLEELADADLLLHVVDAADEHLEAKYRAVEALLEQLGLSEVPTLVVMNKADLLPPGQAEALARRYGGVAVSATRRKGLGRLIETAEERLTARPVIGEPEAAVAAERAGA
jgi:GTP-binding protein HflX